MYLLVKIALIVINLNIIHIEEMLEMQEGCMQWLGGKNNGYARNYYFRDNSGYNGISSH